MKLKLAIDGAEYKEFERFTLQFFAIEFGLNRILTYCAVWMQSNIIIAFSIIRTRSHTCITHINFWIIKVELMQQALHFACARKCNPISSLLYLHISLIESPLKSYACRSDFREIKHRLQRCCDLNENILPLDTNCTNRNQLSGEKYTVFVSSLWNWKWIMYHST